MVAEFQRCTFSFTFAPFRLSERKEQYLWSAKESYLWSVRLYLSSTSRVSVITHEELPHLSLSLREHWRLPLKSYFLGLQRWEMKRVSFRIWNLLWSAWRERHLCCHRHSFLLLSFPLWCRTSLQESWNLTSGRSFPTPSVLLHSHGESRVWGECALPHQWDSSA